MQISQEFKTDTAIKCFHCGEVCPDKEIFTDDKYFCCLGCKVVYEILNENKLCKYYEIDDKAGVSLKNSVNTQDSRFAFLEDSAIKNKLIDFTDGKITSVTFFYSPNSLQLLHMAPRKSL